MVSQIFQQSLKLQLKFVAQPPPKYTKSLLYNHLGFSDKAVAVSQNALVLSKVKP